MLLAVLLPKVLIIAKPLINSESYAVHPPTIIIFSIIIILAVCSYFFRFNMEEMPHLDIVKAPVKAYSIMPLIFIILALNDVIAPASLHQIAGGAETSIERYYCLGIILGIAIIILLQKRFSINICNMLNISFALLAIGFTVNLISLENNSAVVASAVCFGTSYAVGFINIYYLAGFMTKKFQSVSFYRVGIVLSTIYYFIAFVTLELFENSTILAPSTLMAFISVCIVIIFFMLSPFFVKMLYSGEWFDDAYRTDVTKCSRLESKLRDYKLTPAEMEVCRLLLDGFTLRQIAGILSRAYSTINTYCTSIYRKLNINSRTELLLVLQDYIEK
jgi:DNA-binding CsgD family transcriptional regulator